MLPENRKTPFWIILLLMLITGGHTGAQDYYLGNPFSSGDTVWTNTGFFYDAGYTSNYSTDENWFVWFCAATGSNPITVDFEGFATHYGGTPPPPPPYTDYDWMTIQYPPGNSFAAYHDDTPEFSFTSPSQCIRFGFRSQPGSPTAAGWKAEIYSEPPPANNDICTAAPLIVGNVCTPQNFTNRAAYGTGFGGTPCHDFFGGDVWFSAVIPSTGNLKIETFPGSLTWAVLSLYEGSCGSPTFISCSEDSLGMPTAFLSGRTPGETIYIRLYGDQAKSGTFGICASDPTAQIDGATGPGGVGDDSTNIIWLRADRGTLDNGDAPAGDGDPVKTWQDQSGNDNHLVQASGSAQALLTENLINGLPALRLDGSDDLMMAELNSLSAPMTMIAVGQFTDPGVQDYMVTLGDANKNQTISISRENDDRYFGFTDDARYYGPSINDNTFHLYHARHNIFPPRHSLFLNETTQTVDEYPNNLVTDGTLILGASRSLGNHFGGDIAELIIYEQVLNDAQKIIVENYLSAKYGFSISQDKYDWESSHGHDVAGIGQVDASNQHTEAQSNATLSIGNPTDLDNAEFLLFGHDDGDISGWTSNEQPNNDPDVRRIAREWRVDVTGDPGLLTITLSDSILPDTLPGFTTYVLWMDADGDFTSGAIPIALAKVDETYVANAVSLSDGMYLTAGTVAPMVGFTLEESEGLESLSNPQIEISLNYALNQSMKVSYRAIDGTATGGGVDYLLNPGIAVIAAGVETVNVSPLIKEDTIVEIPDEYFDIRLFDPDAGLTLSPDSNHRYTILNNDILITASSDKDTISACLSDSANFSVTVEGTGPYTYAWSPAGGLSDPAIADPSASPDTSTWYSITVTDQTNGSVGTDSILLAVIPRPLKPTITPGGSTTLCDGDSVLLSASAGDNYLWSTGENTPTIYAKTGGSYTVKIVDDLGCESDPSDAVEVTVNARPGQPVINPADGSFCPGDSLLLSTAAENEYLWSNGANTREIHVSSAGDYWVRVRNAAGCWSDTSALATVNLLPKPALPVISPSGATVCTGDSVQLSSSAEDGYEWSNGETGQEFYTTIAGEYWVRVRNTAGCWSDTSALANVAFKTTTSTPSIGPSDTSICLGDSILLTSSPADNYLWSNGETGAAIWVSSGGDYSVRVSNAGECQSLPSSTVTIAVNPVPVKPVITGSDGYCEGDSVLLQAPISNTYLWSTGDTSAQIYAGAGNYSLTVRNADGCSSDISDIKTVTEYPLPPQPQITGDANYCEGDSGLLSGPPATRYIWSSGDTTQSIEASAGNYTLVVGNENGCLSPASTPFVLNEWPRPPRPVITPAGPIEIWLGDSVILNSSSASDYYWLPGGETTSAIVVRDSGSYTVNVVDANGCSSEPSFPVLVRLRATEKPLVTITGDTAFCEGTASVDLTAPMASAWLWSDGQTTQSITVSQTGSYTVTVFDEQGHPSFPSDPVRIQVWPLPALSLVSKSDVAACHGDETGMIEVSANTGTTPYTYTWLKDGSPTGQTGASISELGAGRYLVQLIDANACQDTLGISITQPEALRLEANLTQPFCPDSRDGIIELTADGGTQGYTAAWADGVTGLIRENLGPGSYSVILRDANLCELTGDYTLGFEQENCLIIPTIITPNNDGKNDRWRIPGIELYPDAVVEVFDRWGKRIFYSDAYDDPWDGTNEGKDLPMDSYHFFINLNNGTPPVSGNITILR